MSRRGHLLVAVFICLLAPPLARPSGFVDSAACRSCHTQIYDAYKQTPMGRSFYLPESAKLIEDWEVNNHFYHRPSGRHYEMQRREDGLFVRRYQLDPQGRQVNLLERRVTHIMGSGERARSYLHQSPDGRIIELPVSWYSQEKRWAMAPGYDRPNHRGFTRLVNHKCMFCHNAYPEVEPQKARQGWDHAPRFPAELPMGIDCQRCHGPGAEHIRAAKDAKPPSEVRRSIVNPARLDKQRELEVCMQCHLETTTFRLPDAHRRLGRGFYSYRPGEPLGDYILHFDHAPATGHDDKFEIVSAAYRLRQSPCFVKSQGELTCTTCHDPHGSVDPEKRQQHYRSRCLTCHSLSDHARHKLTEAEFSRSDCVGCHMPLRRTEDVVHVAMTDHRIQRRKPNRDLLAPLREKSDAEQTYRGEVVLYYPKEGLAGALRDVYLGIAQVKEGANLDAGIEMLKKALAKSSLRFPEPYWELAEAQVKKKQLESARRNYLRAIEIDPSFVQAYNNLANLLADMGQPEKAIEYYRQGLKYDPENPVAYKNLGLTLIELDRKGEAVQAFRRAIAAYPDYAPAYLNLGAALLAQAKLEEAKAALEQALALDPGQMTASYNLAFVLVALDQKEEAVFHLRQALKYGDEALRESARNTLKALEPLLR